MATKKSFAANLQQSIEKQDKSLKDRFAAAESVLMSAPTEELKKKAKPKAGKEKVPAAAKKEPDLVIRDTFSMPPDDYAVIERLRSKAAMTGRIFTKSEIVRAGLLTLAALPENKLIEHLDVVERIKPGRKV